VALGLSTGSTAEFLPIAIYDARAGRMFRVERSQGVAGWTSERVDITTPAPSFAIDIGSLTVGWVSFAANGPDFVMVPLGQALPARPSADHKQGFRCKIAGNILGGVREFSHSAKCVLGALDALHSQYEASAEAWSGQVPVVRLSGTIPVVTKGPAGNTTNYGPTFEIVSWIDRLPEFGERTVPAPTARAAIPPAPTHHAPPPTAHVSPPGHVAPPAGGGAVPAGMPFARA
jgi:hypothetical protein